MKINNTKKLDLLYQFFLIGFALSFLLSCGLALVGWVGNYSFGSNYRVYVMFLVVAFVVALYTVIDNWFDGSAKLISPDQLDYARSVKKRLDEFREDVDDITARCSLPETTTEHLATLDDYLMYLHFLRYGNWPVLQESGSDMVRKRPSVLGECRHPEYLRHHRVLLAKTSEGMSANHTV